MCDTIFETGIFYVLLNPKEFWICKEVCRSWRASVVRRGRAFIHYQVLSHTWSSWERQKAWRFFLLEEIQLKDCNYKQLASTECNFDAAILRDVNRTLPKEHAFQKGSGQNYLFRVLRAWAHRLWEIGYCQGLNFLAATLLHVFDMNEELAFECGLALLLRCHLVDYFRPNFPKVGVTVWTFDRLVQAMLPKVYQCLDKYDISAEYYGMSWFLTLFASELPQPHVHRIWDLFLTYGFTSVFQVGLALLYRIQDVLLNLDTDHTLRYLKAFTKEPIITQWHPNDLMATAFRFPVSLTMVHALETCYLEHPKSRTNIRLFTVRDLNKGLTHWSVDIVKDDRPPEEDLEGRRLPRAFLHEDGKKKKMLSLSPVDFLMHNMDTGQTEMICLPPTQSWLARVASNAPR
eukprot:GEMP01030386.1.p1 GENE.GEMP01030386.1~~GEMP01030386.1.p1  ORF type:complete len:403 (+),score=55.77 GEMP01030386.1:133-1341(+)